MIPIPRITLRTGAEILIGGLLVIALMCQTFRIEGFKLWPIHVHGLKEQLADAKKLAADTQEAFDKTVADYRAKAEQARRDDAANKARVEAEQSKISQETSDAYEARLAAARATAQRLRDKAAAANSSSRGTAPVPGLPAPAGGSAQGAAQDGFSLDDRLLATEQAIQLDELIKWVRKQHGVDVNGAKPAPSKP